MQNQFLTLNDDDIEFLDEVQAKKRREEQRLKKEMEEGLKAFRDRQKGEEVEKKEREEEEGNEWSVGRKRKRVKERDVKVKRVEKEEVKEDKKDEVEEKAEVEKEEVKKPALALVDFGSDSDDD